MRRAASSPVTPDRPIAAGRAALGAFASALILLAGAGPAQALETIELKIPILETSFTLKVSELVDSRALFNGRSDLAELNRATGGRLGRQLHQLLATPLPLSLRPVVDQALGSPLLEQALLVLSSLGTVRGQSTDLSGERLQEVLIQASGQGQPTVLNLLQAIPGESVSLDLGRAIDLLQRLRRQQRQAERLLAAGKPASPPAPADARIDLPLRERRLELVVPHRQEPLVVHVVEPARAGQGRLVLLSHGLWDSPDSFRGWARLLASRGSTVLMPIHPGSDRGQRQAMLNGQAPPPRPAELRLRPLDLQVLIDAAADQRLGLAPGTETGKVVVIGHSWGATTALQLAGVRPSARQLAARCLNPSDPDRNLSWTLQCSWLSDADQAALADSRVIAVAAVSPPTQLLFDHGAARELSARVLLVSGSRDWVVPPDLEALEPFRGSLGRGHQLVLAQGGDHFNLRPGEAPDGGVLGHLLAAWVEGAFAAGDRVRPGPGAPPLLPAHGWGHGAIPLVDVSGQLAPL
jgi:predicted dienelactone hydrolase